MQPVQDLTVEDRVSRTQYPVQPRGSPTRSELGDWVPRFVAGCRRCRSCATWPAISRTRACRRASSSTARRPRGSGITPQMLDDALYDAFGQRQISTMFTQSNQYRVVLETRAGLPAAARRTSQHVYMRSSRRRSVPLGAFTRVEQVRRAACREPSGAVPGGHGLIQSGARRIARRRRARDRRRPRQDLGLPASIQTSFRARPRPSRPRSRTSRC